MAIFFKITAFFLSVIYFRQKRFAKLMESMANLGLRKAS